MSTNDERLIDAMRAVAPVLAEVARAMEVMLKQAEAPAPAPLKYAPGQVVMVPMVVISAETGFTGDELPYQMQPLAHQTLGEYYVSVQAVEPPAPQVGDVCWFWDDDGDVPRQGNVAKTNINHDYLADFGGVMGYYRHCVRANDPD